MNKPVVTYKQDSLMLGVEVGKRCMLFPLDHTSPDVSNTKLAITSPVVSYNPGTGRIETQNTVYLPDDYGFTPL